MKLSAHQKLQCNHWKWFTSNSSILHEIALLFPLLHLLLEVCNPLYFPSSLEFRSLLCILGNFGRKFRVYARVRVRASSACGVASAHSRGQLWKHCLRTDRCRAAPEILHMWSTLEKMSTGELQRNLSMIWWLSCLFGYLIHNCYRMNSTFLSQGCKFCIYCLPNIPWFHLYFSIYSTNSIYLKKPEQVSG